jgi:hypothetical protein
LTSHEKRERRDIETEGNEMNVYQYFTVALGQEPNEQTLQDLGIDTPCGQECVKVIEAAKAYVEVADPHDMVVTPLLDSVNAAIEILWIG